MQKEGDMSAKVKKRGQQRIRLSDYLAIFVEGGCNYTGTLKEISLNGLRVNITPIGSRLISGPSLSWFHNHTSWRNRKFKIIISESLVGKKNTIESCSTQKRRSYILIAYPRWWKGKDNLMEIGFEIPESSAAWEIFVQQKVPELN
jgi:hypothetical protein